MKGYRDPARQARRWEAQADAWTYPNGCGHGVEQHREHPSTWERSDDGPVEVRHTRYRPGRFACQSTDCTCEIDT